MSYLISFLPSAPFFRLLLFSFGFLRSCFGQKIKIIIIIAIIKLYTNRRYTAHCEIGDKETEDFFANVQYIGHLHQYNTNIFEAKKKILF